MTPEFETELCYRIELEAAAAARLNFITARRFDFAATTSVAATFVVVEQFVEEATTLVIRITAGRDGFAAANRLRNRTTTVDRRDFKTASRFNGTAAASVVAVVLVVEQFVEQSAAAGSRLAAGVNAFAAASGLDNAAAVAAVVAAIVGAAVEQAETGVSRAASEQEQGQKGGGDHTTHR